MVDHVLRLKLALLGSAFRPGATLARTFAVLVLAGTVGTALVMLAGEVDPDRPGDRAGILIVASALSIGLAVAPLSSGLGSAMEPRRFSSYPVKSRALALLLPLAGLVGLPGALAVTLAVAVAMAWAGTPATGGAIVGGVVSVIAIILTAQVLVALAAHIGVSAAATRTITGAARLVVALSLAASSTTVIAVITRIDDDQLVAIASTIANTPFGLLWAVPQSPLPSSLGRVIAALVILAGLVVSWFWLVDRLLEAPQRIRSVAPTAGLGWFDLVPATPSGVIAARSLLYWVRDERYRQVVLGLPAAPIVMMLVLAVAGTPLPPLWLLPLPVFALFLGWFTHNDVAYDHTAIWLHVAAPLRGYADRWGRAVPPLLLGLPLIGALAPLFAYWSGVDGVLPALLGVSSGLLATGVGVSCIVSALAAYPAARPGEGPFAQPPLPGPAAGWAQSLSLLITIAFMVPALLISAAGFGAERWFSVGGMVGGATGLGMLILGIAVGGQVFSRRAPELLDLVLRT